MSTASNVADLMVACQAARSHDSPATADDLEQKVIDAVQEAHLRGEITDPNKFHKDVTNQILTRHTAHLPEVLGLNNPKK